MSFTSGIFSNTLFTAVCFCAANACNSYCFNCCSKVAALASMGLYCSFMLASICALMAAISLSFCVVSAGASCFFRDKTRSNTFMGDSFHSSVSVLIFGSNSVAFFRNALPNSAITAFLPSVMNLGFSESVIMFFTLSSNLPSSNCFFNWSSSNALKNGRAFLIPAICSNVYSIICSYIYCCDMIFFCYFFFFAICFLLSQAGSDNFPCGKCAAIFKLECSCRVFD